MKQHEKSIQFVFLEEVRKRFTIHGSFVDQLAEVLNISRDSAYRRIRGETILSLDEARILHNLLGISLDVLFSNSSEMVTFHHRVVSYKNYTLEKWINSVNKNLDSLLTFTRHEMIFSARDIPVFHYFRIPELATFKIFFWMKTLFGYPEFINRNYDPDLIPHTLIISARQAWEKYSSISSAEIWNEQVIYDNIRQIQFYQDCGYFSTTNQAISLCDKMIQLLEEIQQDASIGKKPAGGTFSLYNNEILIADNTVLAKMDDRRCVYVNQNALNLLLTFQEPFCEQTENYLQNLMKQSLLISQTGERERMRFFNSMKLRIGNYKDRFAKSQ